MLFVDRVLSWDGRAHALSAMTAAQLAEHPRPRDDAQRLHAAAAARLVSGPSDDGPDLAPFDMDAARYATTVPGFARTLVTPSVAAIPGVLIAVIVAYAVAAT